MGESFKLALNASLCLGYRLLREIRTVRVNEQRQRMNTNVVGDTFQLIQRRTLPSPFQRTQIGPACGGHRLLGYVFESPGGSQCLSKAFAK
jgi:hypothetical protein